jgi:hypothetical protein
VTHSVPLGITKPAQWVSGSVSVLSADLPPSTLEASDLRAAKMLDLTHSPASPAGIAMVAALCSRIAAAETRTNKRGKAGTAKLQAAVGAIIGGVLTQWAGKSPVAVFHSRTQPKIMVCRWLLSPLSGASSVVLSTPRY